MQQESRFGHPRRSHVSYSAPRATISDGTAANHVQSWFGSVTQHYFDSEDFVPMLAIFAVDLVLTRWSHIVCFFLLFVLFVLFRFFLKFCFVLFS
jgi:hypothetical protein